MQEMSETPQVQASQWLLEMEAISSPTLVNALILNIKKLDSSISDVQILMDSNFMVMLVLIEVELGFFGKLFKNK